MPLLMNRESRAAAPKEQALVSHIVAHTIVKSGAGDLVFTLRSSSDKYYPGKMNQVTEHLERGETPLKAALRGLGEELGLRIAPERMEGLGRIKIEDMNYNIRIYASVFTLRLDEAELKGLRPTGETAGGSAIVMPLALLPGFSDRLSKVDQEVLRDFAGSLR